MSHTLGPWKWLKEDYRGDWGFQYLVGPEEEGILVGADEINRPSKIIRVKMPIPSDEVELAKAVHIYKKANANLIAAAPEMLEALERTKQTLGNIAMSLSGDLKQIAYNEISNLFDIISKAKGESL